MSQITFNVPRATLQTHFNEKVTLDANPWKMSRFTYQEERNLVDYACNRTDMGVRFDKNREVCEKHGKNFKSGKP